MVSHTDHQQKEYSIGVDIGGTKICIGIVDTGGRISAKSEIPTGPDYAPEIVAQNIDLQIKRLLEKSDIIHTAIRSIGFGIPGTTDSQSGMIEFAPNMGWRDVSFGKLMYGKLRTHIYLTQETHAAVLAEYLFGAGMGCENIACVAIGTGIGCGLILDGRLHRGTYNTAGEFGHLIIEKNGRKCACGRKGCIEAYSSGRSIRKILGGKYPSLDTMSTEEIFETALNGNQTVRSEIISLIEYIGVGLVNIVNLLSPEKVLLTGGLSDQEELVIQPLRNFVRENAYAITAEKITVERAALGKNAPVIGAAMLHRFIEPYVPG